MQLSDDQIVKLLIAKYKASGLDLANIITDPVFLGLPLKSKLDTLKTNAPELAAGINSSFTKEDGKNILKEVQVGAISGAVGVPFALRMAGAPFYKGALIPTLIFGAVAGAAAGGVAGGMSSLDRVSFRNRVQTHLRSLSGDPTEESSVKAMSDIYRVPGAAVRNRLANSMLDNFNKVVPSAISGFYQTLTAPQPPQ